MRTHIEITILLTDKDAPEDEYEALLRVTVNESEDYMELYLNDKLFAVADWKDNMKEFLEACIEEWG